MTQPFLSRLVSSLLLIASSSACSQAPAVLHGASRALEGVKASASESEAFPRGFLWGVATAGFQFEGGDITSNWAAWERDKHTEQPIGQAVDFWHRYEEDLDRAQGMGLTAFRMGIEWARIEPSRGNYNPEAIAHYHAVLAAVRKRGMEPIVTVSHWAFPAWLDEPDASGKAGWESNRMPQEVAREAAFVAKEYGSEVRYWLTLNEPNTVGACSFMLGMHPPGKRNPLAFVRAMDHMVQAHKLCYTAIHANAPNAQVSINPVFIHHPEAPAHDTPGTLGAKSFYVELDERDLLDQLAPVHAGGKLRPTPDGKTYLDYMAFNYFTSMPLLQLYKMPNYASWPVYPEGLFQVSTELWERYQLPQMVTENGMATNDGKPRQDGWTRDAYIVNHLGQLRRAIAQGVPVLGYMHWSLEDNYEWGSYKQHLGLYAIDRNDPTLARVATSAVATYGAIARANAIPMPLLDRYWGHRN